MSSNDGKRADRARIELLIRRLIETERELQELAEGQLDAVVDPTSRAPILLLRAQHAIAESEARFRDLINRCPAVVCEISPDGTTLFTNAATHTVLGYAPHELIGTPWWSLVADEDSRQAGELISVARRSDVTGVELRIRSRSGEPRWLLWNTANRYDARGQLEMIVAFGLDITQRKEVERARHLLEDAQLARAQAEAANKAKMEFLAVMSHELRTPLNAIAGYAQLIELGLRGPVTPEQLRDLEKIRRSQTHLLGLINDIMNFARIETGHLSIRASAFSINETLAVLNALTEPQVAAKHIRYESGRCDPSVTAWGDEEKVHQILINLVSNAIKFTAEGGRISVTCEHDDRTVRIHVADTGRGIAPDQLDVIFEPFVQVNRQFTRDEGVGLGLAISRDLARLMHGDLTVESALGEGSRFTLVVPRTEAIVSGAGSTTSAPTTESVE